MTRALCTEGGPDGQTVQLVLLLALGTLAPADWHRSVEIVREVGDRYGFTGHITVLDRSDDLEVVGENEYGARYRFGMAVNTVLQVRSGCHVWDVLPPAEAQRPSPLEG